MCNRTPGSEDVSGLPESRPYSLLQCPLCACFANPTTNNTQKKHANTHPKAHACTQPCTRARTHMQTHTHTQTKWAEVTAFRRSCRSRLAWELRSRPAWRGKCFPATDRSTPLLKLSIANRVQSRHQFGSDNWLFNAICCQRFRVLGC